MSDAADGPVHVIDLPHGRGLAAARPFAAGDVILVAEGVLRERPARTTVQVSEGEHLDVPDGAAPDTHVWRYLNHACRPNAAFRGTTLLAIQAIATGEELTFDYETTEWELDQPFDCACNRDGCERRTIRGFRHLDEDQRRRRRPWLREDLLPHAPADG